jgi:hypothetical protein
MQLFQLRNVSIEPCITLLHCFVVHDTSSAVSYIRTHTHTHTRTYVGEIMNILTRCSDTQHFVVYNTATAFSCVLQWPSNRLHTAVPQNSAGLHYLISSVFLKCYVLQAKGVSESESESFSNNKWIRQPFRSETTINWTFQAKILIDSSIFTPVVPMQTVL